MGVLGSNMPAHHITGRKFLCPSVEGSNLWCVLCLVRLCCCCFVSFRGNKHIHWVFQPFLLDSRPLVLTARGWVQTAMGVSVASGFWHWGRRQQGRKAPLLFIWGISWPSTAPGHATHCLLPRASRVMKVLHANDPSQRGPKTLDRGFAHWLLLRSRRFGPRKMPGSEIGRFPQSQGQHNYKSWI